MALTKVHNRMIKKSAINIVDYGAVGDGVTDDTAAIQAAHDALLDLSTNELGILFIPAGKYKVNSQLNIDATVRVEGYGATLDFSGMSATGTAIVFKSITTGSIFNLQIGGLSGLNIYGPAKANTSSVGIFMGGSNLGDIAHEKSFYDCTISEFGNGIEQDSNSYNVKFYNCYIYRNNINFQAGGGSDTNFAELIEFHGCVFAEAVTASIRSRANSMDLALFGGSMDYNDTGATAIDIAGDAIVSCFGVHFEDDVNNNFVENVDNTGNPIANFHGCTFTRAASASKEVLNGNRVHISVNGGWFRMSGGGTQTTWLSSTGAYSAIVTDIVFVSIGSVTNWINRSTGTGFNYQNNLGRVETNKEILLPIVSLTDGVTAPSTVSGQAQIYVDTADGDLKIKFGDGTVKTIVVDT